MTGEIKMSKKTILIFTILIIIVVISIGYLILNNTNNKTIEETNNNINSNNIIVNEIEQQEDKAEENISSKGENEMSKLSIKIDNQTFIATLYDNETTRELVKQMPLSINMNELNGNEKYYYLKQGLPTNSERIGNIKNGDLMLFGSDCLVLFYKSFSTTYSYTKIGYIDNPNELADTVGSENVQITFSVD
jgi:hypothetical protein